MSIADGLVDGVKEVVAGVTNAIVDIGTAIADGAVSLWNKLFSKEE